MSSDNPNHAKTWELSLYELNRLPHEVITDNTEIAVSPRSLHNELMCPICLDILKNTMTTKECLHRFCHDCIITALRAGNKECPTCRKKLISKRSLRRDPNFDALISKIYPNREEYDALHEKVLEKLNKKHLSSGGGSSVKRNNSNNVNSNSNNNDDEETNGNGTGASRRNSRKSNHYRQQSSNNNQHSEESQQSIDCDNNATTSAIANLSLNSANVATTTTGGGTLNNHRQEVSRKRTISDESDMESRTSTERSQLQNDTDELELILKPHPKEITYNSRRFLKTTANATVNHLSKYLSTRLCLETSNSNTPQLNHQNGQATTTTTAAASSASNKTEANNSEFNLFIISDSTATTTASASASTTTTNGTDANMNYQSLSANMTLEQIVEKYWKLNKPLELYYISK